MVSPTSKSSAGAPAAFLLLALPAVSAAQAPSGYYDGVDTTNAATLRATLHAVIDDHVRFPYTAGSTDTWNILELADEDPTNSGRILDVYKNASYAKQGGGNSFYNREHTWPQSYGNPDDGPNNSLYTDCHQLFLCDSDYNTERSNKPFDFCGPGCSEQPTDANAGEGGGSGGYPGNSNWTSGAFTTGAWETWIGRRGDVARALFYLDVRYEGGTHGGTNAPEPDLILTNSLSLIDGSNTGKNESVAYMGYLSVLLQWHAQDPPDAREMERNDVVFGFQGNRNPFIDHPEWVDCIFSGSCTPPVDTTPPAPVASLGATPGDGLVSLQWAANTEPDLDGYNVYRALETGGPYTQQNGAPIASPAFADGNVVNGVPYFYVVTAVDTSGNESGLGSEVFATPQPGVVANAAPWINELHYDDSGADSGESVEIAGPAGLDLAGWRVVAYDGANGEAYDEIALSGTLADLQAGLGTLGFGFAGLQDGGPDGLALVDSGNVVVEFLSYEGSFTAGDGPANGLTSTNIGVSESGATPAGTSLQRTGFGSEGSQFSWSNSMPASLGSPNDGQEFVVGAPIAIQFGIGTLGPLGVPVLHATSVVQAGAPVELTTYRVNAGIGVLVAFSLGAFNPPVDLGDGLLLNVNLPILAILGTAAGADQSAPLSVPLPPSASGLTLRMQAFALEGFFTNLFASSPGLALSVP